MHYCGIFAQFSYINALFLNNFHALLRYFCTVLMHYCGILTQFSCITAVFWHNSHALLWYFCTILMHYCGIFAQFSCITAVFLHSSHALLWYFGTILMQYCGICMWKFILFLVKRFLCDFAVMTTTFKNWLQKNKKRTLLT